MPFSEFSLLYNFNLAQPDGINGQRPNSLIFSKDGNTLYGTTEGGGESSNPGIGYGVVFSLSKTGGEPTILYDFSTAVPAAINGQNPNSLIFSKDGNTLYGTTSVGGVGGDAGVVFSLPKTGGEPTILYDFSIAGGSNGNDPRRLVLSADGNTLYGTTFFGGGGGGSGFEKDNGIVFSLSKTGTSFTILYNFNNDTTANNGKNPNTLLLSADGKTLYGTTENGEEFSNGAVFSLLTTGGEPTVLYNFPPIDGSNGDNPNFLVLSADGNTLYGTTSGGGVGGEAGVVFSLSTVGGSYTILYDFNSAVPARSNGILPSSLVLSADGNTLYGVTFAGGVGGGEFGAGVVFSLSTTGASYTILHDFNTAGGSNGAVPISLVLSADGNTLYGVTGFNEASNQFDIGVGVGAGVVFALLNPQPVITNICFPAGTPITTDQGVLPIDQLDTRVHTIRGQVIRHITQTLTGDPYLICLEKDALGRNVPTQRTIMSKEHQIEFNGQLVPAERFLNFSREVKKVKYTGEILYNVLLAQHGTMTVNGLQCETLHPTNLIAKLYTKKMPATEREAIIIQMNTSLQKKDFVGYKNAIQKLA
jgi:uncharacterized repeat protein (TIGR03803 family)